MHIQGNYIISNVLKLSSFVCVCVCVCVCACVCVCVCVCVCNYMGKALTTCLYLICMYVYTCIAKQKPPKAVKKGILKQSRIKRIIWHLKWLASTSADISLQPSVSVRPKTDI